MPQGFSRRTKPQSVQEWLKQLDSKKGEDSYAQAFLSGDSTEQQDEVSGDTIAQERQPQVANQPKASIFRRLSHKKRETGHLPPKRNKDVDKKGFVPLEDAQIEQRLAGKDIPRPIKIELRSETKWEKPVPGIAQPEPLPPAEPRPAILKLQQAQIRDVVFDELRPIATQGYDIYAARGSEERIPIFKRLREWFEQLPNLQKMFLGGGVLILVAGVLVLVYLLNRPANPQPVAMPPDTRLDPSIPIPASVILPDGQVFTLAIGSLVDGQWTPQGAEWLAGTEVPRWLALPWNNELEKAINTYKINDPIKLKMNNGDKLVYQFQSVQEIALEDMAAFHANTADLVIVLSKPQSKTRLVVIAAP